MSGEFSLPLLPIAVQPAPHSPYASAWCLWEQWRGPAELVAQVARASVWALRDAECDCTSRVDVYAYHDIESFSTPSEFLKEVSSEALKGFDAIVISVGKGAMTATTIFARRGDSVELWPNTGVLAEVTAHEAAAAPHLESVRTKVARAIERGRPKDSRPALSSTAAEHRVTPQTALARRQEERQELPQRESLPSVWRSGGPYIGALIGILLYLNHLGDASYTFDVNRLAAFAGASAVVGSVVGQMSLALIGNLELDAPKASASVELAKAKKGWRQTSVGLAGRAGSAVLGALASAAVGVLLLKLGLAHSK